MIETTIPLIGVGLDAAILYSQKGMDVKSETGTSTNVKTDYIDVPVNLKWKFGLPIIKGYLAAGPYIGFRVGGDKFWEIPGSVVGQVKAKNFSAGLNFGYSAEKYDLNAKNRGWSVTAAILF